MKPQIIHADGRSYKQRMEIVDWLKSNGCPWLMAYGTEIQVTGNHIIVRTWTIKNIRQSGTLWPKRLPDGFTPPTKLRKYRIRHELRLT